MYGRAGFKIPVPGTSAFGNDPVADFGGDLDEAPLEQRESMIHGPLERAARPRGSPGCFRRRMAVAAAAAALVVAQHRDGEPACSKLRPSAPLSLPHYLLGGPAMGCPASGSGMTAPPC
ncbi:DUF4259 domain-containing protein [Streptomyces sp. NBC_01214]|uniref:DUF4259 domain-containing protein n=1 Tax=Streptomyces sp. NBC_01214 TaxID=2903777 RepID=UPI00338E385B